MSDFRGTPGPWNFVNRRGGEIAAGPGNGTIVASIAGSWSDNSETIMRRHADGLLISAMPDLFEAVESAIFRLESYIEAEQEMPIASMEVILDAFSRVMDKATQ